MLICSPTLPLRPSGAADKGRYDRGEGGYQPDITIEFVIPGRRPRVRANITGMSSAIAFGIVVSALALVGVR